MPPLLSRTIGDEPKHPRLSKKWTLRPAPAPLAQPYEGAAILDELGGGIASELWQRIRDVQLWTQTAPQARSDLFRTGASGLDHPTLSTSSQHAGNLAQEIHTLRKLCEEGQVPQGDVVNACLAIAEWAHAEGYTSTCVEFAEAAARIRSGDSDLAFNAGRANRRKAAYERAEAWFDRAHGLARRSRDPIALADALLGWGNLEYQRGRLEVAHKLYVRAWNAAKKAKIRRLGASAQHNLLILRFDEDKFAEAVRHAELAAALYPKGDARIPYLAHDTALVWMNQGFHAVAMEVFLACAPFITAPVERVQLWANVARSAGALRNPDAFYKAWDIVSASSSRPGEFVAMSLVNVAEGARSLGLQRQALTITERAREFARIRGETLVENAANRVLSELRTGGEPDAPRPHPEHAREFAIQLRQLIRNVKISR